MARLYSEWWDSKKIKRRTKCLQTVNVWLQTENEFSYGTVWEDVYYLMH